MSLSCYPIAWVCAASGTAGSADDVPALTFALVLLLGLDPFFLRRNYLFNGIRILFIVVIGPTIAALGWLFNTNFIVLVWMGKTYTFYFAAQPTAYGMCIQHQIELEERTYSNPPTGKRERLLMSWDFLTVLMLGLVVMWLVYSVWPLMG